MSQAFKNVSLLVLKIILQTKYHFPYEETDAPRSKEFALVYTTNKYHSQCLNKTSN